jgi:hypothetical protein
VMSQSGHAVIVDEDMWLQAGCLVLEVGGVRGWDHRLGDKAIDPEGQ